MFDSPSNGTFISSNRDNTEYVKIIKLMSNEKTYRIGFSL